MYLKTLALSGLFLLPTGVLAEAPIGGTTVEQPEPITTLSDTILCSCVKYARSRGHIIPYGTNASQLNPNSQPSVGALALFNYPNDYHVAIIESIHEDGFSISETNYSHCRKTTRFIRWDDKNLRGFAIL